MFMRWFNTKWTIIYFSGSCYIKYFVTFTVLELIIYNNKSSLHCTYGLYLITMNTCTSLHAYHLCMHWYNVLSYNSMKYEGVRTLLCRCRTQPNYINEAYVPLVARHVLVPWYTREQRKGRSQANSVCSLESDFSVTLEARRVICLIRKTKKARVITLASDWPSGASMIIVTCAKTSRNFHNLCTDANCE